MKNILITGASTGIGAATALELAHGNRIFIHYNQSADAARQLKEEISRHEGEGILVAADLSTREGCEQLLEAYRNETDHLDVLFNNVGGMPTRHNLQDITWEIIDEIFRLNSYSSIYITKLFLPLLQKGADACVINMTSLAMRTGAPGATAYAASKGAIDAFTRGIAKELAPEIRVNAVAPGVIDTPFHEKSTPASKMASFKEANPLRKHGQAEDIAKAVRFIMENTFLNGETIDINGGIYMR